MHNPYQGYFFVGALILVGALSFTLVAPFLQVLILAAASAVVFRPVYIWLYNYLRKSAGLAALLTTMVAVAIVIIPLLLLGVLIFTDTVNMFKMLRATGPAEDVLLKTIRQYAPDLTTYVATALEQVSSSVAGHIGNILSGVVQASLNTLLFLMAFFYLLKDGDKFIRNVINLSPLDDKYDIKILRRMELAVNSVVRGTVVIALLQGMLAGIGMAIFGVPSPMLWGGVAAIVAMVPTIGTAIVLGPAVMYLLLVNAGPQALGLTIWSVIIVGLIDNVLSPQLIGRNVQIHPFFILLSVFGGLSVFGPIGFLFGPLLLSLLFALVELYPLVLHPDNYGSKIKRLSTSGIKEVK